MLKKLYNKMMNFAGTKGHLFEKISKFTDDVYTLITNIKDLAFVKKVKTLQIILNMLAGIQLIISLVSKLYTFYYSFGEGDGSSQARETKAWNVRLKLGFANSFSTRSSDDFINSNILFDFLFKNNIIQNGYSTDEPGLEPIPYQELRRRYDNFGNNGFLYTMFELEYQDIRIIMDFRQSAETYAFYFKPGSTQLETEDVLNAIKASIIGSVSHSNIHFVKSTRHTGNKFVMKMMPRIKPLFFNRRLYDKMFATCQGAIAKKLSTGVLLYGKPGVSKTSTLNQVINDLNVVTIYVNNAIEHIEETIAFLQKINVPKALVFEDIDITSNAEKTHTVTNILKILDARTHEIAIMTANSTVLPEALIRSGRFNRKLHCMSPESDERIEILDNLASFYKIDIPDNFQKEIEGLTHADIDNIARQACITNESVNHTLRVFASEKKELQKIQKVELQGVNDER